MTAKDRRVIIHGGITNMQHSESVKRITESISDRHHHNLTSAPSSGRPVGSLSVVSSLTALGSKSLPLRGLDVRRLTTVPLRSAQLLWWLLVQDQQSRQDGACTEHTSFMASSLLSKPLARVL